MREEEEVGFLDLIGEFNRHGIRHLIIGRRAVILYGGPVLTADHDLWIRPEDKRRALLLLKDDLGCALSHSVDTRKPIVTAYSGMKKYDLFFLRRVKNIEDNTIDFDACHAGATVIEDKDTILRIPSIDHLIELKKVRERNVKDEQDIAYLLQAKKLRKTR